jgi:transcriptional regulator with XRE-family HTH domain
MDGDDIRQWRAVNRVKQDALASMLGVSRVAVSKWESGLSRPSKTMALRLSEVISGVQEGRLGAELAFMAPQQQTKALVRRRSLQLIGISAGFRAMWPEMSEFLGAPMRPWLMNEALNYCEGSDLLKEAIAGDVLMLTGVSNRLLKIGGEVPENLRLRWHTIVRRIDGELIHEIIFEPCASGTPTGFERVLRRSDIAGTHE